MVSGFMLPIEEPINVPCLSVVNQITSVAVHHSACIQCIAADNTTATYDLCDLLLDL